MTDVPSLHSQEKKRNHGCIIQMFSHQQPPGLLTIRNHHYSNGICTTWSPGLTTKPVHLHKTFTVLAHTMALMYLVDVLAQVHLSDYSPSQWDNGSRLPTYRNFNNSTCYCKPCCCQHWLAHLKVTLLTDAGGHLFFFCWNLRPQDRLPLMTTHPRV